MEIVDNLSDEEQDAFGQWLLATGQSHLLEEVSGEEAGDMFALLFSEFAQTAAGEAEIAKYKQPTREQLGFGPEPDYSIPPVIGGIDAEEELYLRSRYDDEDLYGWAPKLDEEGRVLELTVYDGRVGADTVEKALRKLAKLRHVRKATIDFTIDEEDAESTQTPISADCLLPLTEWKHLEEIDIIFGEAPPESLLRLCRHNPLSELRVSKIRSRWGGAAAVMQAHRSARRLQEVHIDCRDLTDDDLRWLGDAAGITSLSIAQTRVTGTGLESLKCQGALHSLSLSECPVSDKGLRQICQFGQLTKLSFSGIDVTDGGFRNVGELRSLRDVLFDTLPNVSNEGFKEVIARLEHIEKLSLGDVPFNDEIIPSIAKLPNLHRFFLLGDCRFTRAGLQEMQSLRPDCHVSA